jgi:hypothetical protein
LSTREETALTPKNEAHTGDREVIFIRSAPRSPALFGGLKAEDIKFPSQTHIHDDETAQSLGFRGATIAGSIHMDQFPPVLVEVFGSTWLETGSLSLSFKNATLEGEEVVAMVATPPRTSDVQVDALTERADGMLVALGTASVGQPDELTCLHSVDLRPSDPGRLRILHNLEPGTIFHHTGTIESSVPSWMGPGLSGNLDWYRGPSPWGGPIANPSAIVQLLRNRLPFTPHVEDAVGLFGAIEIRHEAGPVFRDTKYEVTGEIAAVGESPKTEYAWFDSRASDRDGRVVATMRMQLRWMKMSSPLYE